MNKIVALRTALLLAAATMAVSFARPASAQLAPSLDLGSLNDRTYTPEQKERMQEIDKNYQATMKKVPDKQKANDPWAGTRQDSSNGSNTKR
jgi:hypothetical protein